MPNNLGGLQAHCRYINDINKQRQTAEHAMLLAFSLLMIKLYLKVGHKNTTYKQKS